MLTKHVCGMFLKAQNDNSQITDLLQLSKKEQESRIQCMHMMRRLGDWKKTQGRHEDARWMVYARIEGILLKRQVQDAIFFYRLVKKDRVRAFSHYMEKLPARSFVCGAAR